MNLLTIAPKEDGLVHLTCANGALLEVPVYEQHARGTNYLAIIDIDPTMPAGLARIWAKKGRGPCLYITDQITQYDALEFAADYTTSVSTKKRLRWYGVVVDKRPDELVLQPCNTGVDAVLLAKRLREKRDEQNIKVRVGA